MNAFYYGAMQCNAMQNKTKQNKTKQNKTKQNKKQIKKILFSLLFHSITVFKILQTLNFIHTCYSCGRSEQTVILID